MIRAAIVLLACLALICPAVKGLASQEETALNGIISAFPSLLQIDPMDQYDAEDYDWGGSWTKPINHICADGDGWDVQGIHCSGGHIDGVRLSHSWGFMSNSFPDISGLTWLTHFSTAPLQFDYYDGASANAVLTAILALPSLRSVKIESWPNSASFPVSAFQASNLTHAYLHPTSTHSVSLSGMSFLEEVTIWSDITNYYQFASSAATLRSLIVKGSVTGGYGLEDLFSLENLELASVSSGYMSIPSSLKSLTIHYWEAIGLSIGDASSQLEELDVAANPTTTSSFVFLPSTLKRLRVRAGDYIIGTPLPTSCNLEEYELGFATAIPNLTGCTSLKKLRLYSSDILALNTFMGSSLNFPALQDLAIEDSPSWPNAAQTTNAHNWLCSAPSTLRRLSLRGTAFKTLPACVSNFLNLEALNTASITGAGGNNLFVLDNITSSLKELTTSIEVISFGNEIFWQSMVDSFPNLRKLDISRMGERPSSVFPGDALKQLTSLESLTLRDLRLTGPIPADFFGSMQLNFCDLSSNGINGALPSSGWGSLTHLDLSLNQFATWTTVDAPGAPFLKTLLLSDNLLTSIPSDSTFLQMMNLRLLDLSNNYDLTTLPRFWANGDHKLQSVVLSYCAFNGPLPTSIRSPYLRYIYLEGNQFCGPLPELTAPVSLNNLNLQLNRISGSIPASWGDYLTVDTIFLNDNLLSGSIPDPFFTAFSHQILTVASLENNYLTGAIPNMTQFVNIMHFDVKGVNMTIEFCSADSPIPSGLSCSLQLDPSICECSDHYPDCSEDGFTVDAYCSTPAFNEPSVSIPPRTPIIPPYVTCASLIPPETMTPLDETNPTDSTNPSDSMPPSSETVPTTPTGNVASLAVSTITMLLAMMAFFTFF